MGKMGRVTCMICGEEFDINDVEETFTGRPQYRCMKCVALGRRMAKARMIESQNHGVGRKIRRQKWK